MIPWHLTQAAIGKLLLVSLLSLIAVGLASSIIFAIWLRTRGGYWSGSASNPGYQDNLEQDNLLEKKKKDLDGWR